MASLVSSPKWGDCGPTVGASGHDVRAGRGREMLLLCGLSAFWRRPLANTGLWVTGRRVHVSEGVASSLGNAVVVGRAAVATLLATGAVTATTSRTCTRSLLGRNVGRS